MFLKDQSSRILNVNRTRATLKEAHTAVFEKTSHSYSEFRPFSLFNLVIFVHVYFHAPRLR